MDVIQALARRDGDKMWAKGERERMYSPVSPTAQFYTY